MVISKNRNEQGEKRKEKNTFIFQFGNTNLCVDFAELLQFFYQHLNTVLIVFILYEADIFKPKALLKGTTSSWKV